MSKRRWILTPDEVLDMAKAMFEAKFGTNQQPKLEANPKPMPTLLPKPERVPNPKGQGVSIQELRKAQKAERKRARFNKKVLANLSCSVRKLTEAQRQQIKAAKAAYRAAVKQQREQAQAAIRKAEAAKRAAEALRKQVEAARQWLRLEEARARGLDRAAKERIQKAKARGFRRLPKLSLTGKRQGPSCPLFGHIRGLATAAAVIWAAEQAK